MISEERLSEIRAMPDRAILEEILRIAGFQPAQISDFRDLKHP